MKKRRLPFLILESFAVLLSIVLYGVPFYYVFINSVKSRREAGLMKIDWPEEFFFRNYLEVLTAENYAVIDGFKNSILLTLFSILVLVTVCGMIGFVMQRRNDRLITALNLLVLTGLMIPIAIVPTIWVLQGLGIYKTLTGMVLVEVALHMAFGTILYRGFMATIPRDLDEAAIIDGCGPLMLYTRIILPLLKPVTSTIIVITSVNVFNDFIHPLYFLPGRSNITVQTTLYYFMGMYFSQWHYLFADVMLISIPPLLLFIFFNKRIVAGLVAGAIKG